MNFAKGGSRLWSIVLAGGEESRVGSFILNWLGTSRPKQYCTFVGTRSLFQHTVDRAAMLSEWAHIVPVVSRKHEHEARNQLKGRDSCFLLTQPSHASSMAAIYVAVTHIRAQDPEATVVVYPSDHFVYPESRFLEAVQRAVWTVEWLPDRLVLLGISPDHLQLDFGWITPGEKLDASNNYQISAVRSFVENPTVVQADAALASGGLWNTNVLAAKAKLLWELGWQYCPAMMMWFERLTEKIEFSEETSTLETIYQDTLAYDISSGILRFVPDRIAVVEMKGILWSDWNKPERIAHTLRRIGRQPAFPLTCLNPPFAPLAVAVSVSSIVIP